MKRTGIFLILLLTMLGAFSVFMANDVMSTARKAPREEYNKPSSEDMPFVTVDKGTTSGITTRERFVIKDEAQWLTLWRRHTTKEFLAPAAPSIDFNSEMVIAVFAGQRNLAGYAIDIERIRKVENKLVVSVTIHRPLGSPGIGISPMGVSEPFEIVRLAQNNLPVIFQGI